MFKRSVIFLVMLFLLGACTSDRSFQPSDAKQLPVAESPASPVVQPAVADGQVTGRDSAYEATSDEPLNRPPEISKIGFVPDRFMPGDLLGVDVSGDDPDGDEVTFTIDWTVNGSDTAEGPRCSIPLRRGDKVTVRITPYDGTDHGQSIKLEREIMNFPPQIQADEGSYFDGTTFQYQVRATDPDGDTLTYSLQSAPPGMTIVSTTGQIKWLVPEDFAGVAPISIIVKDGEGGQATYEVKLNITEEAASL